MATLVSKMDKSKQQAVKSKYGSSKFLRVSKEESLQGDIIKTLAKLENWGIITKTQVCVHLHTINLYNHN